MFRNKFDLSTMASILVLILINYSLLSIVYSGHKRENIAAKGERAALALALRHTSYDSQSEGPYKDVLVVNATLEDTLSLPTTQKSKLLDLDASVYAEMIEKADALGAQDIILGWLSGAHQLHINKTNEVFEIVDRLMIHDKITLTASFFYMFQVPKEINRKYSTTLASDCIYKMNIQCSIPDWDNWIFTKLYKKYAKNNYLSKNLTHQYDNLILNLPAPKKIEAVSAKTFLSKDFTTTADVIIFGNDVPQPKVFENNKIDLQRTRYAKTNGFWYSGKIQDTGVPLSNFFAAFITMLRQDKGVYVANKTQENTIAFLCSALILFLYLTQGLGPSILSMLALLVMLIPISYVEIQYLDIYIPKFFISSVLFLSVISIVYLHLFWVRLRGLRSQTVAVAIKNTVDIRKNFLSLISHNLKTPIAQIQGGIEYLGATDKSNPNSKAYRDILSKIAKMNSNIGTMLKTATLKPSAGKAVLVSLDELFSFPSHLTTETLSSSQTVETNIPVSDWHNYLSALTRVELSGGTLTASLRPSKPGSIALGISGSPKKQRTQFEERVLRQYIEAFEEMSGMTSRLIRQDANMITLVIAPKVAL